jgi:DNA helicase IV
MRAIAAGGFKDITRIASSDPTMWEQICMANPDNIIKLMDMYQQKLSDLKELISKPEFKQYKKLCIICKDTRKAVELAKSFGKSKKVSLITSNKDTKAVIAPVGLSKGLEFDYVIVVDADDETYKSEADRNLLYVACTRAMHKLDLIYGGQKSKFI